MSVIALPGAILVILACALLAVRRQVRLREAVRGLRLRPGPTGETPVPVTATFIGGSHNSLRPSLLILPHGVRFKVLGEEIWAFSDLTQVSVGSTLFGASLSFSSRQQGRLRAHLASRDLARQVLTLLPPDVPLSREAAALRREAPDMPIAARAAGRGCGGGDA